MNSSGLKFEHILRLHVNHHTPQPSVQTQSCLRVLRMLGLRIPLMCGGHCSLPMQINAPLLKSPLFCPGVTAERQAVETPAVVREALEQQARDRP
ncbi:hypothetical protein INR49_022105 [Caranx melampygus]|nr:hypothetical protein INR49_022105 [Caranx melampygus]